jgi:RimJ/RimL family protein N-acetyltransferase
MLTADKVRLRNKSISDARDDFRWQSDPELARLDAAQVQDVSFARFLAEYSFDLYYPLGSRHEFAIENLEGKHIGNCVFYNMDTLRSETEIGIMIGDREYWGKGYGTAAVNALLEHVFSRTSIEKVHLKTLDWNIRAQKCFEKCGFTRTGYLTKNGFNFVRMELYRSDWLRGKKSAAEQNSYPDKDKPESQSPAII